MNRGGSSGGGQSSLNYLFGGGEAPKATESAPAETPATNNNVTAAKPDGAKQTPAGIHGNPSNNYFRADGQNTGNFITDRPSTKVHTAPGGGSSLGYLFGGGSN
ncbi:protein SPIRAL1-like 2 [Bidens hawaiensis]|uniref:protein SPIRAL1-like 2 n=1 Tax=Bidens hawaiensis TaxID=980011 RepID=UPI004049A4D1